MHDTPLERHSYPLYIKLLGLSLLLLFLYVTPVFLWTELRQHCEVKKKMDAAEFFFKRRDYYHAMRLYTQLFEEYDYRGAKKRIMQSCFACSAVDPELYEYALSYLGRSTYTDKEINELASYLPAEWQKNEFKSIFVEA